MPATVEEELDALAGAVDLDAPAPSLEFTQAELRCVPELRPEHFLIVLSILPPCS